MSYLKRKDGTLHTDDNDQPVVNNAPFIVIEANSLAVGLPTEDILTQDHFNRFVISQLQNAQGLPVIYTANTQTYAATSQDYMDKYGSPYGLPVTATSYLGFSTYSQEAADSLALADAKAKVFAKLRPFDPAHSTPLPQQPQSSDL